MDSGRSGAAKGGDVSERPILFSAPMIRALLAGTKTQTRRVVKLPAATMDRFNSPAASGVAHFLRDSHMRDVLKLCPYGLPGDRLWVRETFSGPHCMEKSPGKSAIPPAKWGRSSSIWYWADGDPADGDWTRPRPSIFMPRWASRITLEITDVRVERVQEISKEDAKTEGQPADSANSPRIWYSMLWDSINGAGSWALNPWVWVVSFRRIEAGR